MPRVSVLMAARDCEPFVGQAIDSVLSQTFVDWELLVADDGSDDATRHVIDSYEDRRIRRFHQPAKTGLVATWNKLIDQARGEYLIWQDADDWSEPNRFERLVQEMDLRPDLMACGSWVKKIAWKSREVVGIRRPVSHEEIFATALSGRFAALGATKIARSDAVRLVGGFREFFEGRGAEDVDLELRLASIGRLANVDEFLYYARYRRGSSSRWVVPVDPLRPFAGEIALFLWRQRACTSGTDGLMPAGDAKAFEGFLELLVEQFRREPALPYRKALRNAIANRDYGLAANCWFRTLTRSGMNGATTRDLVLLVGSLGRFCGKAVLGSVDRNVAIGPSC